MHVIGIFHNDNTRDKRRDASKQEFDRYYYYRSYYGPSSSSARYILHPRRRR